MSLRITTGKSAVVAAAVALTALSLAACSSSGSSTGGTTSSNQAAADGVKPPVEGKKLGVCKINSCDVYKNIDWSSLKGKKVGVLDLVPVPGSTRYTNPLAKCVTAHGGKALRVDVNGDVTKVPGIMQGWMAQGVSAIAELGVSMKGYQSVLNEAKQKHIPVIGWGSEPTPGLISLNADQFRDGQLEADYVIKHVPAGGPVLNLRNGTNPGLTARADGFKYEISKHSNFTLIEKTVQDLTSQASNQFVTSFLQAQPNLVAIQGGFGDWALGAASAVQQAHSKAIVVSANGDPEEYREMAKPGSPLQMTVADGHEFGAQLSCETIAVMLGGGKPFGSAAYISSNVVTKNDIPSGDLDTTPRVVTVNNNSQ